MPMIDYLCAECGLHFDHYFKASDELPEAHPCECGARAERTFSPAYTMRRPLNLNAQSFDPVVVHRDAEGNLRFPGNANAPVPEGYEKVELRTVREIRSLERQVNALEHAKAEDHFRRESASFEAERRERRAELHQAMQHMSAQGRDFARLAMSRSDEQRFRRRRVAEPGFFVEVFSQDSSNRDGQRDATTDWKYRKG